MDRRVMVGFILAFLMLPSIAVSVTAESDALVVPDDYATIQAAIDAASEGAVIHVKAGSYHENLKINKSISLIGAGYGSVFVDGNSSEGYRVPCRIHCGNVSVSGFTFRDGWAGVHLMDDVNYCNVTSNQLLNNDYGIMVGGGSGNRLTRNLIDSKENGYGISLAGASNNLIQANYIHSSAEGIAVTDDLHSPEQVITSQGNKILGNTLVNLTDKAVWFKFTKENLMVGNNITNCAVGLAIMLTDNNTVYQNNFFGNAKQAAGGLEPIWSGGSGTRYSVCQWCNGSVGNYWSDYSGVDGDKNGVGDTPYVVNEANSDDFPLMNPVTLEEIPFTIETYEELTSPTPSATPKPPEAQPLPLGQIIALSASATVAIIGLWLYFRQPKPSEAHAHVAS